MFIIPQSAAPRAVGPPCLGSPHLTERFGAARTRTTPLICGSAAGYQVADRLGTPTGEARRLRWRCFARGRSSQDSRQ